MYDAENVIFLAMKIKDSCIVAQYITTYYRHYMASIRRLVNNAEAAFCKESQAFVWLFNLMEEV